MCRLSGHSSRVGVAVLVATILAVLPSILPYDSLFTTAHRDHRETDSAHCHGASGSCADAALLSAAGQVLEDGGGNAEETPNEGATP